MSWYYFSKQRKYSKGNILNDKFLTFHLISSSKILFCRYYFYFKDFSFFFYFAQKSDCRLNDSMNLIQINLWDFFSFFKSLSSKIIYRKHLVDVKKFQISKKRSQPIIFLPRKRHKDTQRQRQCTYTLFIPVLFELRRFIADRKKKNRGSWDDILHESYPTWLLLRQKRATGGGDKTPQQNGFLVISWPVTT